MSRVREPKKVRGVWEKEAGSGIWWIHYTDADGRRRREKVGRKSDAIELYRKRKADAAAGRKLERPLRNRERLFNELAENARTYARKHKSNPADDEQKINILITEFGNRPADRITQQELTAFLESRDMGPASFNRYRACLSMIYREALRNGWTERNPARLMKAKNEPNGRIRYLTDAEETRLRRVIDTEYPHFLNEFEIAMHTGMRRSEQFTLEWSQVITEERRIQLFRTKNGSDRSIPLNSIAVAAIERQREVTGDRNATVQKGNRVFLTSEGKPFIKKALRHWLNEALIKAKIHDFSWHCLRHTFCSRLIMAGVPLKVAQELMGHKTIAMTARYAHLSLGHLQDAIEMIAANSGRTAINPHGKPTATKTATSAKSAASRRY
jgi:site-specific recombinase XerD